jgi:RNA polymerase sigma-70 factor (ECF subfamily)
VIEAPSDEHLLAAARAGDKQALETLLERHQEQVYRFGMKMCRDPEDAKDVLQDTLLAMARGVRDFRGASSLSTWLYTIARSFCIKKRRRAKFAPEDERSLDAGGAGEAKPLAAAGAGPDEALAAKRVERALEQAIASLEGCARCRGTCESLKHTLALCHTIGPSAPVPASVQASVKTALRTFLGENA